VETGCTYVCAEGDEKHTTTNNLYEHVCKGRFGYLFSFDVDAVHIEFAKGLLPKNNRAKFILGDSVRQLKSWAGGLSCPWVDILCLDSKEFDEDHMVNEYNAIKHKLMPRHFVLVDDIHNPNSVKYVKMVPLLKQLDYNCVEVPTPTGMLVATKGYFLP